VPLLRENIDTDQIIPKQFLKRVERSGYGQFLFHDWRYRADGSPEPAFVLNDMAFSGASILITGNNFGCGSSREHAPWSLLDHGFRAIIAPSFADIFYNNSLKNGLLPIVVNHEDVFWLSQQASSSADFRLTIDLESKTVSDATSFIRNFEIDEFSQYCLLNGLDDIGLTLQHQTAIAEYESRLSLIGYEAV
jgi:3-isopropylmalate/(R)-2-methylmalate dehydratase small subunit